jgi:hypothetical protein
MKDKKGFYRSPEAYGQVKPKKKIIKKMKKWISETTIQD